MTALDSSRPIGLYIEASKQAAGYRPTDRRLAQWAMEAWQKASDGAFHVVPTREETALVRLFWIRGRGQLYGEMVPVWSGSERSAVVFVLPNPDVMGGGIAALARQDPLFRDAIVYLSCLHELGHALGLYHSGDFDDAMYFFAHGGDIPAYFGRYRAKLSSRADIPSHLGLSDNDVARLRQLYPARTD